MGADVEPCDRCGRALVIVAITADDGVVVMRSCGPCDTLSWTIDDEPIDPTVGFAAH